MLQFDTTFYLTTYPDVAAAISRGTIASAQDHYNNFGRFEGRNPSAYFDTTFYLAQNADVAAARVNPFTHFLQFGVAEGRFANNTADAAIDSNNNNRADEFNSAAYLAANPDVAGAVGAGRAFASAYQHYILFGQFEGRAGVTGGPFTNSGTAPNTGSVFALTTGADVLTGTANNDTFNGFVSATNPTLTAADSINGGAGIDTLNITTNLAGNVLQGALLNSIEVVGVRAADNVAVTLDATGLQAVNLTGSNTQTTGISNLANATTVTVGTGANLAGTITAGYVATATAANVAYAGGTSGAVTVTGAGITTANIASTSAASTAGAIDVAGATTININASANLTAASIATTGVNSTLNVSGTATSVAVGTLDTDLRTVNASGLTAGGLTATLSNAAQVVTGGAGNDIIGTGNLGLLTGSVNAGAGTADRLVLTATADLDTAAKGARYTGFEVLQVQDAQSANLDNIAGITAIRINDGATGASTAVNNLTATQAANITIVAATNGADPDGVGALVASELTIGVKGATTVGQVDTVALTIDDGAATVGSLTLGTPVLAGVEKLSINAVDNYTITALTGAPALDSITLTGAATQGITFGVGAVAANFSLNGSAATGVLTIDASGATTNGVAITGGSANDILVGSAQADIINGGAGNDILAGTAIVRALDGSFTSIAASTAADTFTGGAGNDTYAIGVSTVANASTIVGLDLGTAVVGGAADRIVIDLDGAAIATTVITLTAAQQTTVTGAASLADAAAAVLGVAGADGNVATFTYGSDTYLIANGDGNGTYNAAADALIKITGVTGTLDASDITLV